MIDTLKYTFIGFLVVVTVVTLVGLLLQFTGRWGILTISILSLSFALGAMIKDLNKP